MNRQLNPHLNVKIITVIMMLKNVKFVKRGIIALDVILAFVAMIFLFNSVLFPKSVDWLSDMPEEKPEPPAKVKQNIFKPEYYLVISQLPSPIIVTKPEAGGQAVSAAPDPDPVSKYVRVDGTMPESDPKAGSALLFLITKNQTIVNFVGSDVVDTAGEVVPELRGAKMIEVYLDRAVFEKNGRKETLQAPVIGIGEGGASGGSGPSAFPSNFNIKNSASRKLSSSANKEVWEIDPNEAALMRDANKLNEMLNNDVALSPYPSGGVKIDSLRADSVAFMRGVKAGDVIKSINGKEIRTPEDAKMLFNDPSMRGTSVSMIVDRAGRKMTLEYKLGK